MKRLKKDIVIPAGTTLIESPTKIEYFGDENFECSFGLTDDSCGTFHYCIDDQELDEWFEDVAD